MAKWLNSSEFKELDLGSRIQFMVDGKTHTGEVVRCGNTRTWGHVISDLDDQRYEFTIDEEGYKLL